MNPHVYTLHRCWHSAQIALTAAGMLRGFPSFMSCKAMANVANEVITVNYLRKATLQI